MNTLAIIEIPQEKALDIFTAPQGLEPYLQKITAEVESFVPDTSTRKGREEIASIAHRVSRSKTALESVGKKLVAKLKEQPKLVDVERRRSREYLDALRDRVRLPLKQWEQAELDRKTAHETTLVNLRVLADIPPDMSAEQIQWNLIEAEAFVVDGSLEEFESEAAAAKLNVVTELKAEFDTQVKYETDQAELAQLRKDAAKREKKEREERIAREAEERVKAEAEAKATAEREEAERRERELKEAAERKDLELRLAAEREERQKREAEEREKQAVIDAEARVKREAVEKAAAEKAAQEKREANKSHVKKIHSEAGFDLVHAGFTTGQAEQIVAVIAAGEIKHISIKY